ncbi:MAG: hypothetical protein ACR2ND_05060 [Solirubrobacteraceae bacterium]
MDERQRHGLGRGKGSRSIQSTDEIENAARAFTLLDEAGSYAQAVLIAFVRRRPITKDRLEKAYSEWFGGLSSMIVRRAGSDSGRIVKAIAVARPLAESIRKGRAGLGFKQRLRELNGVDSEMPMHRALFDLLTDLAQIMIGVEPGSREANQLGEALQDLVESNTTALDHGGKPLSQFVPHLGMDVLLGLVSQATLQDLELARDDAVAFRDFARPFGRFTQIRYGSLHAWAWIAVGQANDIALAWSVPGMFFLRRVNGQKFASTMDYLKQWTPFFEAANEFVNRLPEPLRIMAKPDGVSRLDEDQRQQLRSRIDELEVDDPELIRILKNPPLAAEIVG